MEAKFHIPMRKEYYKGLTTLQIWQLIASIFDTNSDDFPFARPLLTRCMRFEDVKS